MKRQLIFLCCFLLTSLSLLAQQLNLSGKVISGTDKQPVIGVTIKIKGTAKGTTTDIDGNYRLTGVDRNATLVFTSVGYTTQEINVKGQTVLNVTLQEANELLDEVVVIGYGAVKKSDLTSSISTVKGDEIVKQTTGNAMDALQGRVNGLQVASGGGPGTTPKVIIRGVTPSTGAHRSMWSTACRSATTSTSSTTMTLPRWRF